MHLGLWFARAKHIVELTPIKEQEVADLKSAHGTTEDSTTCIRPHMLHVIFALDENV